MKNKLENKIISICPYMFKYKCSNDLKVSLIGFGFKCGDGWFELIKELVEKLKEIDVKKEIKVIQIKSKYAGLRFYINSGTDEIYDLIAKYESKSESVCEICGKDSKIRNNGCWVYTLCDDCWDYKKFID